MMDALFDKLLAVVSAPFLPYAKLHSTGWSLNEIMSYESWLINFQPASQPAQALHYWLIEAIRPAAR